MNRVALITGGSRGIGRGIALELASRGWDLLINYCNNESAAKETVAACAAAGKAIRVQSCQADLAHAKDRETLIGTCRSAFGRLDLLVNNAGVAPNIRADILETQEQSFDRLIQINVKGPFFLTQAAANWMIQQAQATNQGYFPKIITITSVSAYTASTNRAEYCISKAALSMITPLFAARLAEYGIRVYEIRPGVIETDMTAPLKAKYEKLISEGLTPIPRWGTPQDVAKAVAAIAEDMLPFSTGEVI